MFCDTLNKWKDEDLHQEFCESHEVIISVVWWVETDLQPHELGWPRFCPVCSRCVPCDWSKMCVQRAQCVAQRRCQQTITPETKASLQAVHYCVGPYSLLCVCVCARAFVCVCVCVCVRARSIGTMLMVGQRKQIWQEGM